jgi:hypothetical protein
MKDTIISLSGGAALFAAVFATSAAAVSHHSEKNGCVPQPQNVSANGYTTPLLYAPQIWAFHAMGVEDKDQGDCLPGWRQEL